jgi:site-specific DNA recombinase
LNDNGYRARKGRLFYTSLVHRVLTEETYVGRHWTNKKVRKSGKVRPKDEWICVPVEPIISEELFAQTQLLLASSKPDVKAPRTITSDVPLGGLAKCGTCGGAMFIQTGTGGSGDVFRYFACGEKMRLGQTACSHLARVHEDVLNETVLSVVCNDLLHPDRIADITERVAAQRASQRDADGAQIKELRRNLSNVERELNNLIRAVIQGTLRESDTVRRQQDNLENEVARTRALLEAKESSAEMAVTALSSDEAKTRSFIYRDAIFKAPPKMQRRYVQAFVRKVVVRADKVLSGTGDNLADLVCNPSQGQELVSSPVQSSIREWRSGWDSNPR